MPKQDTLPRKAKKFLFDRHIFDEDATPDEPEIDEADLEPPPPPPPPTFSEDELNAARASSYEQGRSDAVAAEKASREQYIAEQLSHIETAFKNLASAEKTRIAAYEAESLRLAQAIFERLFPGLNEKNGLSEIQRVIRSVLESQSDQPEIIIDVHHDDEGDIRVLIEHLRETLHLAGRITVQGQDGLGKGDCRLRWKDGGAERSATRLAARIERVLKEMLADRPLLHDNEKDDGNNAPDILDSEPLENDAPDHIS